MNTNPKVSIIIPVYNVEPYLRRCLDSVIAQTFTDFEVILVNDGSTDSSGSICNEYASRDPRFKVHHKPNGGVSSARNIGLDIIRGEYVTFIDADDYIDIEFLKILYSCSKENNADLTVSKLIRNSDGDIYKNKLYFVGEDYQLFFNECNYFSIGGKIFKTKIIKEHQIRFNTHLKQGEDRLFCKEIILFSKILQTISYQGYHYDLCNSSNILLSIEHQKYRINKSFEIKNKFEKYLELNIYNLTNDILTSIELGILSCLKYSNRQSFKLNICDMHLDFYFSNKVPNSWKQRFILYILKRRYFNLYRFIMKYL